ncbi:MAG: Mobile element protein, partial [uncultured Craurococcus sp.]
AAHRPPRDRERPEAGQAQVGHRAHPGLAGPLPPPHHPLRTQSGHPPRLHRARLLADLPQRSPGQVL